MATLFFLDLLDAREDRENSRHAVIAKHIKDNAFNLLVIGGSVAASIFLFYGDYAGSVYLYQRIGIGFIQMSETSFFWYVIIFMVVIPTVIFRMRHELTRRYVITGLFIVYLAIGNSIYFFGRSHEANIIHISGSLIFLFFLFL